MKNPKHYGLQENMTKDQTENKLMEMCVKDLNALAEHKIIEMGDDGFELGSTEVGRMMARYCIAFDSMKSFTKMNGRENLNDLVVLVSSCKEFSDIQLRVNEKKTLNMLNKDKHNPTIRYAMEGKIKTKEMKVNCLIQAVFGSILIHESGLNQEAVKIIRIGQRITKCLAEYANLRNEYRCVLNCIILAKCFHTKLWENSKHVARQLDKIGITLTNTLVKAGMTNFQKLADINPRQLEMILNRNPPFGSQIQDAVMLLPKFDVLIEQNPHYNTDTADLTVTVMLINWNELQKRTKATHFKCVVLIGDADNKVVFRSRLARTAFVQSQQWVRKIEIQKATKGCMLHINLINEELVGLDIHCTFSPFYTGVKHVTVGRNYEAVNVTGNANADADKSDQETDITVNDGEANTLSISEANRECNHRCNDKSTCSHYCCKVGVTVKPKKNLEPQQLKIDRFVDELHQKASLLKMPGEQTKLNDKPQSNIFQAIQKFQFTPQSKGKLNFSRQCDNSVTSCIGLQDEDNEENYFDGQSFYPSTTANASIRPEVKQDQGCGQSSNIDLYEIIDLDSDDDDDTSALMVYNGDYSTSKKLPPLNSLQNIKSCEVEDFQETEELHDSHNDFAWDMGIDDLFFDSPYTTDQPPTKHPEDKDVAENPENELPIISTTKPTHRSPSIPPTVAAAQTECTRVNNETDSSFISTNKSLSQDTSKSCNSQHSSNLCSIPASGFAIKNRKSVFAVQTYRQEDELEETLKIFNNIFDGLV